MAKSYPEQLGEWVRQRESTLRDKNHVAFLAVRSDVKDAIEAGYAVKTVWTHMHETGRVKFGYDTFLNYTNRLIRRAQSVAATLTDSKPTGKTPIKKAAKPTPQGFTFDSAPKKEDLL